MNTLEIATPLASIATEQRGAWRVLLRHHLDVCCVGNISLADACRIHQLDPQPLAQEILRASQREPVLEGWEDEPIDKLVRHIQHAYHRPLEEDLGLLEKLALRVRAEHAHEHPRLDELASTIRILRGELLLHLAKEENVLFPWILNDGGRTAHQNIRVLILEHREANELIEQLRLLTDDFTTPPEHVCAAWRTLYVGLSAFNQLLKEHIYLEDDVLFTRVMAAAG